MENKNGKTAVVFDFGGVLIDWNPYYLYRKYFKDDAEIKAFLEEIGFKEWNENFDRGYPFAKGVEELSAKFPQHAELIEAFNTRWLEALGKPMTGTIEVFKKLKESGLHVYGLSNWSVEKFNAAKDRFEFINWFDDFLLSGQVNMIKPAPQIFHIFLERMGLKAGECVFIDDSLPNINTALSLGFKAIHFKSAQQLTEELLRMKVLEN